MKHAYILILIITLLCPIVTKAEDTKKPEQLKELVVTNDRAWIEDGTINVIPSKKEKKLSNSPATLIKSMNLPFLKEKEGSIVDIMGENVAVFINGERANEIDIKTFWPMEVRRVQYLENPSDSKFEGARKVVNFIVDKYELGGVTRGDAFQRFPNNGSYDAASKLVYKKMTYGIAFSGDYESDHRSVALSETAYRNIFYDGEKYDEILQKEDKRSHSRQVAFPLSFNAKYSTENIRLTHTFSFRWERQPDNGSHSSNIWSDNLFGSNSSLSREYSRSSVYQAQGNYYFKFSPKSSMTSSWTYTYGRNYNKMWNKTGETETIFNSTKEDANTFSFRMMPTFYLSQKWAVEFKINAEMEWYSTLYRGSAQTHQKQNRQELASEFRIYWLGSKFRAVLEPGVVASFWNVGSTHEHTVIPTARTSFNYNPTRKLRFSGSVSLFMKSASASESNPVLVKNSELLWVKGLQSLKSLKSWGVNLASSYLLNNNFSFTLGLYYNRVNDDIVPIYRPAAMEQGGLVREYANSAPYETYRIITALRGSFFDNNLSLSLEPSFNYDKGNETFRSLFWFYPGVGADYTLGDFRLSLYYDGAFKSLTNGMERWWRGDKLDMSLTYGTGNLYICLKAENILNNKLKRIKEYSSPDYSSVVNQYQTGRCVFINMTYTFGYGKKVDTNIDINQASGSTTSVIHTSD